MRFIDLETHFFIPEYVQYLRKRKEPPRETEEKDGLTMWYNDVLCSPRGFEMENRLLDLGEARLKDMDANGITIQALSLSPPGVQCFEPADGTAWARKVNDALSKVVKQHPDRYVGLACIAPQSPEEAAAELERAVLELGMRGVNIESHARNEYLDNKKYWCIFEKAEKLGVPIYLHPEIPSTSILKGYADDYGFELAGPPHGYAAEVALHSMRLIYSGLFDRYPKLQFILGHMGEGLPFWLTRMDAYFIKPWKGQETEDREEAQRLCEVEFHRDFQRDVLHPCFPVCLSGHGGGSDRFLGRLSLRKKRRGRPVCQGTAHFRSGQGEDLLWQCGKAAQDYRDA